MDGPARKSDKFPSVIELNVGGRYYTTTHLTLVKCEGTMLSAMFSGDYDVKTDQNGRYFIDADGENFHYILNYLRYGELPPQEMSCKIYQEAVYFGLHGMVEQLEKMPFFLAKIHRDSFRDQFPGYSKLIKSIIDRVSTESTKNKDTVSTVYVTLWAKVKEPKFEIYDMGHICFFKVKNKKRVNADFMLGPWESATSEKEVMNCVSFDLREKGFHITHEDMGQCSYKCESPPDYPDQATVERCKHCFFKITFHWWKM